MSKPKPFDRDLKFLKASLDVAMFPEWPADSVAHLRRMMREDYVRKSVANSGLGQEGTLPAIDTLQDVSELEGMRPDPTPMDGRFIVLAAAQELPAVLHCVRQLGMSHHEVSLGSPLIGHRIHWVSGSTSTTLWLCCAGAQRVDALQYLVTILSERFSPKSIMLTGMMGGIPGKIGFLDVIVPTAIYDGRIIGTENRKLKLEPETGSVHPAVHAVLNNIDEFRFSQTVVDVKRNKKSLTVAAKIDDISHHIFKTMLHPDKENIVGFEMEGQAIVNSNLFQQLLGKNVVLGMAKGVADFGGMDSGQSESEIEKVKEDIQYEIADGEFDPIGNKRVKAKLQAEATKRAFFVVAEISRRIDSPGGFGNLPIVDEDKK